MLQHSERYCQGNSLGDRWAVRVSREYSALVRKQNERYPGLNFIPGWFSWSNTIYFGRHVGATPNGRRAKEAINHGANPHPGFRRDGAVTAMCNSIAAIQPGYGNTAPVQLELDPDRALVDELGGLDKAVAKAAQLAKLKEYHTSAYPGKTDWIDQLLNKASGETYVKAKAREVLGEYYEPFMLLKDINNQSAIQARIPFDPNIK